MIYSVLLDRRKRTEITVEAYGCRESNGSLVFIDGRLRITKIFAPGVWMVVERKSEVKEK